MATSWVQTGSPAAAGDGIMIRARLSLFRRQPWVTCLLLASIVLVLYSRATENQLLNLDDIGYVIQNPHMRDGFSAANLRWAFTTFDMSNWHPVTWLSHLMDYRLFGLNPVGHHFVNVIFHAANAGLLFWILFRWTGAFGRSFFVAALFAVHPLNVESVAWVSERKNVLSTFFWLLTMISYGGYVRRPSFGRYLSVVLFFALGLMTKPMLVTLPLVLLLLDYWPLERLPGLRSRTEWLQLVRLFAEKLPLLVLSVVSSAITLKAQSGAGADSATGLSFAFRVSNALWSLLRYLELMFWPAKLAVLYPLLKIHIWQVVLALVLLTGITAFVIHYGRYKYLPVAWFWYLVALVPVLGIVQVGRQAMADRYAYVPLIGIFILLVWGGAELAGKRHLSSRWLLAPAAALLALSLVTWRQIGYWRDYTTLFSHTVGVTQHNYTAQVNLGAALLRQGQLEDALQHFNAALADNPRYGSAMFDVAVCYEKKGDFQAAIAEYKAAVPFLEPNLVAAAYTNLGIMYSNLGQDSEAQPEFLRALKFDSGNFNANFGLGKILYKKGLFSESLPYLMAAANIQPTGEDLLFLGDSLRGAGHLQEARVAYTRALSLEPGLQAARNALAGLEAKSSQPRAD